MLSLAPLSWRTLGSLILMRLTLRVMAARPSFAGASTVRPYTIWTFTSFGNSTGLAYS